MLNKRLNNATQSRDRYDSFIILPHIWTILSNHNQWLCSLLEHPWQKDQGQQRHVRIGGIGNSVSQR